MQIKQKWHFRHGIYTYLGRLCFDMRSGKNPLGLVRSIGVIRRGSSEKRKRYWVWINCIIDGVPFSYRFRDDQVGYIEYFPEDTLSADQILRELDCARERLHFVESELSDASDILVETSNLYRRLLEDLRTIMEANGIYTAFLYDFILTQHYLRELDDSPNTSGITDLISGFAI